MDTIVFNHIDAWSQIIKIHFFFVQQLDNVAITSENAKRYFHGVPGDKRNKGELYGLENMFTLRTGDSCLTLDILKVATQAFGLVEGFEIFNTKPDCLYIGAN